MGLPHPLPPGSPGSGRGPFGEKAFRGALIGCVVLIFLGSWLIRRFSGAVESVGVSCVVLAVLGLLTAGAGLLAERYQQRGGRRPR